MIKPSNKHKELIYIGLGTAALATIVLAWEPISNFFKGNKPENNDTAGGQNLVGKSSEGVRKQLPTGNKSTPEKEGPNLDKKLTKGMGGDEVKRLQVIINEIEAMRGKKSISAGGKNIQFPLDTDGKMGPNTYAAALDCFPSLKTQGYITLHQARLKWAYSLGYYDKPFSATLVNSPRIKEYQVQYKMGSEQGKGKGSSSKGSDNSFMFQMP